MKARIYGLCCLCCLLASCISTKNIPDDDQLFVGLTKITYDDDTVSHNNMPFAKTLTKISSVNLQHLSDTKSEVDVALATAPNGALFGSSYYHLPFSWRLWVFNRFSGKESAFASWMLKLGKPPVLMSKVNPALRASVAQSVLRNNGYLRSTVDYEPVPRKNPKKSKLAYHVHLDTQFAYDSISYVGFPAGQLHLIDSTRSESYISRGLPFSVSSLENERTRISNLMRSNGYYYFVPSYTTFLADTFSTRGCVQMRVKLADGLPEQSLRQWYIGNTDIYFRKSVREQPTDSIHRRHLHIFFTGKKPPIRPRVVLKNMRLRPRQLFNYENYQETVAKINATGVFSSVDFQFTPRDNDTLDLRMNCTFDKPYDFYFETNLNARTIGRFGPEVKVGFTHRNTFHGGEKLDVNLHGNYEWQKNSDASMNSYQYGADASIEFPRIIAPFYNSDRVRRDKDGRPRPRRFISASTTLAKVSADIVRRPDYYKMHIASGEWTYRWQSSEQSRHEFSPLTLKYQYMNSSTVKFDSLLKKSMYLSATMQDQFIPKMRYTYVYNSPTALRNPIRFEATVEEAGNGVALYDVLVQGNGWNEKDKTLFKNPYSQFVRAEADLTKTWRLGSSSSLVGHLNAGYIYSFGNSSEAPFSEMFYAGGANSIRAFTVRSIGPGAYYDIFEDRQYSYSMQNGDMKLVANLEYRSKLFGNLEGALFLDVGNVWMNKIQTYSYEELRSLGMDEVTAAFNAAFMTYYEKMCKFKLSRLVDQTAVGTGVGLRYDLSFLVIRLDWGLALHAPYDTGNSGYFNIHRFKDAQALHFAIGYPF